MTNISLNYEAVQRADVALKPCPHSVIPDFISGDALKRVVALLPDIDSGGSYPPQSVGLHPDITAMIKEFQGQRLKDIISKKFDLNLNNAPSMVTMRGRTREKDGRIHRDSDSKRVTILLYLNNPERDWSSHEGCLRFVNEPHDIEDYEVQVPPVGGTLVIFPNGPKTWHGHKQYIGSRYTVQLNYMTESRRARYELIRHKISAVWKRLTCSI